MAQLVVIGKVLSPLVVVVALVACSQPEPPAHPKMASRPNILLLVSDDHSADDLGFVGAGSPRTPALDALAGEGARFTNAYASSPQCSPSRASIVTGRSPHATGTARLHSTLTDEYDTVVDALRKSGYHVGAFRKVHLGESFQKRWQFYGGHDVPFEQFFRDWPRDHPFFLWVGFHDPHRPYEPGAISPPHDPARVRVPGFLPDTEAVRRDLASYYDEIARMDAEVARILMLLNTDGLAQNTIVVFTGDNGMPFPGAKGSLYNAGVRVPLIVRWPEHVEPGQVRREVVSLLDLVPTWLEAAGVQPLPRTEGRSLLPALTKKTATPDLPAFFERNWHDNLDLIRGVRSARHLLIQNYRPELPYIPTLDLAESPSWIAIQDLHTKRALPSELERRYFAAPRPEVELYDIEADPYQLQNLATESTHVATVRSLQGLLSKWMIATNDFLPPPIPLERICCP